MTEAEAPTEGAPNQLDPNYDDPDLKIILLGDSAVGKSKLIERYLMNEYNPRQLSTFALTLFRREIRLDGDSKDTLVGKSTHNSHQRFDATSL
jgi:GTPase SAR1 family protein